MSDPLPDPFTGAMVSYPFGGGYAFGDWMYDASFPLASQPPDTLLGGPTSSLDTAWKSDLATLEPAIKAQLTGIVVHFMVNSISTTFTTKQNPQSSTLHVVEVGALTPPTAASALAFCPVTVLCPT